MSSHRVMVGHIEEIHGYGQFPSVLYVMVRQVRTRKVFLLNIQHTQSWHPLAEVAEAERHKREAERHKHGVATGCISLQGVRVAFIRYCDDLGFFGAIMHYDEYRQRKDREADES